MKQEVGGQNKKSSPVERGSPLQGNANNPNMANIPERRKTSATPTVSSHVKQVIVSENWLDDLILQFPDLLSENTRRADTQYIHSTGYRLINIV